jgi:parallel beta-helix repeat protein
VRRWRPIAVITTAGALIGASAPAAGAASGCDVVAAPNGSDSAAGSESAPLRTLAKLNATLTPGQTGCLRAGTWNETLYVKTSGVTVTSYPGERAKVVGPTSVSGSASGATVAGLDLVGTDVSPLVYGRGARFVGNDVTNQHAGKSCFLIGDAANRTVGAVIEGNTIHDCGRLPATNLDHGIYVLNSDGARISGNVLYGNADWAIQFYPDADNSLFSGNIVDGNGKGVTFGGGGDSPSRGNVVEHNVISHPTLEDNLQSYWGSGGVWRGSELGNLARENCVWGGREPSTGGVNLRYGGYTAAGNVIAEPEFVDRAGHDYRLKAGSRCAAVLAGGKKTKKSSRSRKRAARKRAAQRRRAREARATR